MRYNFDLTKFLEIQTIVDSATPPPWNIWDGPAYCGGGHDYCIGAGDVWLADMDHRYGKNHDERVAHQSALDMENKKCTIPDCPICLFSSNVTKEQRNNAVFITKARNEIIPWLINELKMLKLQYDDVSDNFDELQKRYDELYEELVRHENKTDNQ